MHYIPVTVLEFSSRFRMGSLSTREDLVMCELSASACADEAMMHLCGLFTEESDVVFAGFSSYETCGAGWITIPATEVKVLHPLNHMAGMIILQKLGNMSIGEPVPDDLREKMVNFKNRELAERGATFLLKYFGFESEEFLAGWRPAWKGSLDAYRENHHFEPATLPDYLVKYERTKFFEKSDIGFLEDSASIAKQSMLLPDGYVPGESSGNNCHLDEAYALLKRVAGVRRSLIDEGRSSMNHILDVVTGDPVFGELNGKITSGIPGGVNTFAMMIIYLKLRDLIRGINGEDGVARLERSVTSLVQFMPREAATALCLAGMRFGINEFAIMFSKPDAVVNSKYAITQPETAYEPATTRERTYHSQEYTGTPRQDRKLSFKSPKPLQPKKASTVIRKTTKPRRETPLADDLFTASNSNQNGTS